MSSKPAKVLNRLAERRHRRFPRYRSVFAVQLMLFSSGKRQHLDAHCRDLSVAGIGLLVAAELPIGEVVSLSFALPDGSKQWEIRAVLRYRRGYHYGFEFLSCTEQETQTLATYLAGLERTDSDGELKRRAEP